VVPALVLSAGQGSAFAARGGDARSGDTTTGGAPSAVYTLTNAASGNAVVRYTRAGDGTLTSAGTFPTGGDGSGSGLGSQGALAESADGHWLFAVNAGSNTVSTFRVEQHGLTLTDQESSRGAEPISLTAYGRLLYVLNGGGAGNITGFDIRTDGTLIPIRRSTRLLSGNAVGPAQVQFSPRGDLLVVTEKATNLIDTWVVGNDGRPHEHAAHQSAGQTPFGFAFDPSSHLIVSEAHGGAPGASTLSSYEVSPSGGLTPISPAVPDTQTAACWVVVTANGRYTYTTNTGSGTVSSYRIRNDGGLSLLSATAGATGSGPIDEGLSTGSGYLYVLNGDGTISAFKVRPNGGLTPITGASGLPSSAAGLVAR